MCDKKALITTAFLIFVGFHFHLWGQVPFGPGQMQIERDEDWYPLFFSIDADEQIHLPDYYKNRIVVFKSNGSFIRSVRTFGGMHPAMNWFSLHPDGSYIIYSQSILWVLDTQGMIKFKYEFPLGFLPEGFYLDNQGLSLKTGGISLFFPWSDIKEGIEPKQVQPQKKVPLIHGGGTWTFNLGDQAVLSGWKISDYNLSASAVLIKKDPNGHSWWSDRNFMGWTVLELDSRGRQVDIQRHSIAEHTESLFSLVQTPKGWVTGSVQGNMIIFETWGKPQ